jgi:DNA-binding MarR family transcriptional regulator
MLYANDRLLARLEEEMLREHSLELSWYEVLLHVTEADGRISQRDLLSRLLIGQSGLSRILTRMEAAHLVRRSAVEADKRNLWVELTDAGRERLRLAAPTHIAGIRRWFADRLTARQLEAIRAGLSRVLEGLSEEDENPAELVQTATDRLTPWTPQGPVSVTDTIAVRDALAALVVADAARSATASDIADLRNGVSAMAQRIGTPREFFQAARDLQRRVAVITPNLTLRSAYASLLDTLDQAAGAVIPESVSASIGERLRLDTCLVEAIAHRDGATAAEVVDLLRGLADDQRRAEVA